MAGEYIELSKNWDPKQAAKILPAYAQIKYDGVPLRFIKQADGSALPFTRQGELAVSVPHLEFAAQQIISRVGGSVTAEVFLPGKPFKDSSGAVRKQSPNHDLVGVIFDADIHNRAVDTYSDRINDLDNSIKAWSRPDSGLTAVANEYYCKTVEDVEAAWEWIKEQYGPDIEGMMLHKVDKTYQPGKRRWETARYKPQPTIDLEVVGFEEAVSEAGDGLGMVGRVNVRLVREWPLGEAPAGWAAVSGDLRNLWSKVVGVGPGKLTHDERTYWWSNRNNIDQIKLFAAIKYMPDSAYEALRQPTVQFLRTDKENSDVLSY